MLKSSRLFGLFLAFVGTMVLLNSLDKPHVEALRGSEVLRLVASGMCFGVALMGLMGRLTVGDK